MNKIVKFLAQVFCFIVFPVKSYRKILFDSRKKKAIKMADKMQKTTPDKVMVMQDGVDFYVGVKSDFKHLKKRVNKKLKIKHEYRNAFDWKSAIIYSAK